MNKNNLKKKITNYSIYFRKSTSSPPYRQEANCVVSDKNRSYDLVTVIRVNSPQILRGERAHAKTANWSCNLKAKGAYIVPWTAGIQGQNLRPATPETLIRGSKTQANGQQRSQGQIRECQVCPTLAGQSSCEHHTIIYIACDTSQFIQPRTGVQKINKSQ